ncbi:hypothetical protein LYZ82_24405, partial [Xanthomonas hortorum pv. hederae]|uniref:hypothetical protein n=1 Tax=Xanthomonas hortorum TaxID=56454 RepID=UPI001F3066D6
AGLLALAQAFSVAERQLHGLLLNMRRVVSRIYGALFRGSLEATTSQSSFLVGFGETNSEVLQSQSIGARNESDLPPSSVPVITDKARG